MQTKQNNTTPTQQINNGLHNTNNNHTIITNKNKYKYNNKLINEIQITNNTNKHKLHKHNYKHS